jgi:hypothetical protein
MLKRCGGRFLSGTCLLPLIRVSPLPLLALRTRAPGRGNAVSPQFFCFGSDLISGHPLRPLPLVCNSILRPSVLKEARRRAMSTKRKKNEQWSKPIGVIMQAV